MKVKALMGQKLRKINQIEKCVSQDLRTKSDHKVLENNYFTASSLLCNTSKMSTV